MDNLDALLTDLQAATAAMTALNGSWEPISTTLATAAEDSSVDATWGSASRRGGALAQAAAAPPFPRMLPSLTSPPTDSHNGWHNGFSKNGTDSAGLPSPHSKKQSAPVVRESAGVNEPLLSSARVFAKDLQSSPAHTGNNPTMTSSFGRSSTSAAANLQVALGYRPLSPSAIVPSGGLAAISASGGLAAISASGGLAAISPSGSTALALGRGFRDKPDVGRDSTSSDLPPALPPPPSQDIIDSFYRDMADEESFYEPQNLAAHRNMSSSAATAESVAPAAAAELRWRTPQLRQQPSAGAGASPIVRSSLAHNLCELDALLQELGASPVQQQPHSDFTAAAVAAASSISSVSASGAADAQSLYSSSARAGEVNAEHDALYAPVLSRAIVRADVQQQRSQLAATGMLQQSEAERPGAKQPSASAARTGADPASASRQQQQPASFATRELDELMATLSQLKVNTSAPSSSVVPLMSSGRGSPGSQRCIDNLQQQQQRRQEQNYAHICPPAALLADGGLWLPDNRQLQQQPLGVDAKLQQLLLQQAPTLNGQAEVTSAARWTGSPAAAATDDSGQSSAVSSPSSLRPGFDLDNMLGHLETDLSRQGAGVVAKGHCVACDKAVVGQVVTALGRLWHPEHFCCTQCRCELARVSFYERDGRPYCERDYHDLFAPKCAHCGNSVIGKCVTALGVTWHPECFSCAACGRMLADEGFHEKDGRVYCMHDFFHLFSPRCGGCCKPIHDNFVAALNRHWHPACFVCTDCGATFSGGSFFDHDGMPYCEMHYHSRKGSLCAGCQKPVLGRCVAAMSKKFHPEHFVCAFCLRQLNKGTFKEQNDKPYCHACFAKLFS